MIKFKVPATIGNVGPGFDVLGLAVDGLYDEYIVEESEIDQIIVHGIDSEKIPKEPENNTVFIAAYKVSELINKSHINFKVTINRSLPSSGGMGSSAASSVAGAIIPFLLNGMDPEEKIVIEASLEAETVVSGQHLDNILPAYLGGLYLVHDVQDLRYMRLALRSDIYIALFTPFMSMPTKESRKNLQGPVDLEVFVKQMANSLGTAAILSKGNLDDLKYYMEDLFSEPVRTKDIEGYKDFKLRILELGAKAVGLSGGGPTQYAICDSRDIANKVLVEAENFYGELKVKHSGKVNLEGVIYE